MIFQTYSNTSHSRLRFHPLGHVFVALMLLLARAGHTASQTTTAVAALHAFRLDEIESIRCLQLGGLGTCFPQC